MRLNLPTTKSAGMCGSRLRLPGTGHRHVPPPPRLAVRGQEHGPAPGARQHTARQ